MAEQLSKQQLVYLYQFDYFAGFLNLLGVKACHVSELFGLLNMGICVFGFGFNVAKKIGHAMRQAWGYFAHNGVPIVNNSEQWLPYDKSEIFIPVGRNLQKWRNQLLLCG